MKILFLPHEQYVDFDKEAGYYEIITPILSTNLVTEYEFFIYQRERRKLGDQVMERKLLKLVNNFKPDIIIYLTTWPEENLNGYILNYLNKLAPVVNIRFDSQKLVTRFEINTYSACDYIAVLASVDDYIRYRLMEDMLSNNSSNTFLIAGHNINIEEFKSSNHKNIDVGFYGSMHGLRVKFLEKLSNMLIRKNINITIAGGNIDDRNGNTPGSSGAYGTNADWLPRKNYLELMSRTKIMLNIQTIPNHVTSIKGKIFEGIVSGCQVLTDYNSEIFRLIDNNYVHYYSTIEECFDKIQYLLNVENNVDEQISWYKKNFDVRNMWIEYLIKIKNRQKISAFTPIQKKIEDIYITDKQEYFINKDKIEIKW